MTDAPPVFRYAPGGTPEQWGLAHGEHFRQPIAELAGIRRELMRTRNPALTGEALDREAHRQFAATQTWAPDLMSEFSGIQKGAGLSLTSLVILNNYTDFRDIELPEEGCSTVGVLRPGASLAGQTWDMHGSAKPHVLFLEIPESEGSPRQWVFSLNGCLGMAGFSSRRLAVGVNNLNTRHAASALIWPALVRKMLAARDLPACERLLREAKPTSGHAYLVASAQEAQTWEVSPRRAVQAGKALAGQSVFHTNHCLDEGMRQSESSAALSSTTFDRYGLLEKKVGGVADLEGLTQLLMSHDGYPKSICSHFNSGLQDPSMTCGGFAADLQKGRGLLWRGCPQYDAGHSRYEVDFA